MNLVCLPTESTRSYYNEAREDGECEHCDHSHFSPVPLPTSNTYPSRVPMSPRMPKLTSLLNTALNQISNIEVESMEKEVAELNLASSLCLNPAAPEKVYNACRAITEHAPNDGARTFLRDKTSQLYLSIVLEASSAQCRMTSSPASLFVCHRSTLSTDDNASDPAKWFTEDSATVRERCRRSKLTICGFEHEGLPSFGNFLSFHRSWWQAMTRVQGLAITCDAESLGQNEEFQWHSDGTLRHVESGLWVYVDPLRGELCLHETKRSVWQTEEPV